MECRIELLNFIRRKVFFLLIQFSSLLCSFQNGNSVIQKEEGLVGSLILFSLLLAVNRTIQHVSLWEALNSEFFTYCKMK